MAQPRDKAPKGPPERTWDPQQPRLREVVSIEAIADDGKTQFGILLTRVPCVGEYVANGHKTYRVAEVHHAPVDPKGWTMFGWHALIDVEFVPDPEPRRQRRNRTVGA